jgi:hypothetical protein
MLGSVKLSAAHRNVPLCHLWGPFTILSDNRGEVAHPATAAACRGPGGHMVLFLQSGDPKRPTNFPYSDADRAAAHRTIFGAYAGKYTVEGDKVVHHITASWRPEWNGTDQTRYFTLDGNKLTLKTAPQQASVVAGQIVSTLTFERVE